MSAEAVGHELARSVLSPPLKDLLAGGVGGMAGVVAGQPLDTIRIRLQQKGSKYSGFAHAWASIVSREGPLSLFKGMSYPLSIAAFQAAVSFYAYGTAMRVVNPTQEIYSSYWDVFACGVFAGAIQSFVITPADVLKIRLQLQTAVPGQASYIGPFQMMGQILRRGGAQGFFRGISATLMRDVPSHGMYFYVYHRVKDILKPHMQTEGEDAADSALGMFVAGGVAGVMSWPLVYPLDVMKSRIQVHDKPTSPYRNWMHCGIQIYKEEGCRAFLRGLTPTLWHGFIGAGAVFLAYESTYHVLNRI